MKSNIWFELPKALICLNQNVIPRDEQSGTLKMAQEYQVNIIILN